MRHKSKNLILIIGNGFDLAHKFKTSYNDFSNYIIEKKLTSEIINSKPDEFKEPLISGKFIRELNRNMIFNINGNFIQRLTAHKIHNEPLLVSHTLKLFSSTLKGVLNNQFLGKLFDNAYENWFDIENAYFTELISIEQASQDRQQKLDKIIELNANLLEIKKILFEYLKTIKTDRNRHIDSFFKSEQFKQHENVYVVNFNYTITIENYLENNERIKINYIHGDIESEDIIFGYGNDQDVNYKKIKEARINEYLRFFKTFEYLKNKNYSDIYESALEKFNDYDVSIIGHSLGLTDKTLLKEILNNSKCKRIHLFKRSDLSENLVGLKEEFNKQIFSISRIIDNERDLRVKVLNYEESDFFP